jgi:hypothetical protein
MASEFASGASCGGIADRPNCRFLRQDDQRLGSSISV